MAWVVLGLLPVAVRSDCPLELRSYEDVEGRGFVLELDPPPPPGDPMWLANARILHPERGEVFRFQIVAQSGYGQVLFVRDPEESHVAYFLSAELHVNQTAEDSPYLFIEGLGLADWVHREASTPPGTLLGDVVWELTGCKE